MSKLFFECAECGVYDEVPESMCCTSCCKDVDEEIKKAELRAKSAETKLAELQKTIAEIESGVHEDLPALIASLRARAEKAELERDLEIKLKREALYQAELEADRATKAEAERDSLANEAVDRLMLIAELRNRAAGL